MSDGRRDTPPPPPRLPDRSRRDSDAPGLSAFERLSLWHHEATADKLDAVGRDLRDLGLRVTGLELHKERLTGKEDVRSKVSGWAIGLVTAILVALVTLALRGITKP
jgi:hypothetical protein